MFLRGKKLCRKKTKLLCSVFCLFLSVLLSLCSCFSVSAVSPNSYNVRYSANFGSAGWHLVSQNEIFNIQYLYNYEWKINSVYYAGNFVNIHFETNIVMRWSPQDGKFHNLNSLVVNYCGSNGANLPIRGSSVSYHVTQWNGTTPSFNTSTPNQTLTVYADLVVDSAPQGQTQDLYCNVGLSNNWAFAADNKDDTIDSVAMYFEQQPTTLNFTSNQDEAFQQQQLAALDNISSSIDALANDNDEMEVYEREQADLEDKGDELEEESGDLSLNAQTPSDPFSSLFPNTGSSTCRTLSTVGSWFGNPNLEVCSPYPSTFYTISNFVTAAIVFMLIVRVYTKHLKGGVNG